MLKSSTTTDGTKSAAPDGTWRTRQSSVASWPGSMAPRTTGPRRTTGTHASVRVAGSLWCPTFRAVEPRMNCLTATRARFTGEDAPTPRPLVSSVPPLLRSVSCYVCLLNDIRNYFGRHSRTCLFLAYYFWQVTYFTFCFEIPIIGKSTWGIFITSFADETLKQFNLKL